MTPKDPRISTGTEGLDLVLGGGLTPARVYLLEGAPGSGKTTMALQFLFEGAARGERCLYITLSETRDELAAIAASHGWDLDSIDLFELSAVQESLGDDREQTILHPWEVELSATVDMIMERVEDVQPTRLVFDSLSELRLLAQDSLRYRRQVLGLKQYFSGKNITVLLVDDMTTSGGTRDNHLHSIAHGVVTLERNTLDFGAARRRLEVQKMRGIRFAAGYHDMTIDTGRLRVFPSLIAAHHGRPFVGEPVSSGIATLDGLMDGGPLRGTSVLLSGPAGSGKTTIAFGYAMAACARGEPATIYEFDERVGTLIARTRAMNQDPTPYLDSGLLRIVQMDPADITPGHFAWMVRQEVDRRGVRVIVLDSMNGYLTSMPQEKQLLLQLHELLSYLNQEGVLTLLLNVQSGPVGSISSSHVNVSYIADVIMLFRFFEANGRIRKALSVLKNRGGAHEDVIRELLIDAGGVRVGDGLTGFRGVLTGTPQYEGPDDGLMEHRSDAIPE
jgi:circadian clock protein KaiC